MHARFSPRGALAAAIVAAAAAASTPAAIAGGMAHRGAGYAFRPVGGLHAGFGAGARGFQRFGGPRGVPPISGVIHERPGARPYLSAYGHTGTALRSYRPSMLGYGRPGAGYRPAFAAAGAGVYRRVAGVGEGRRRFAARGGFAGGGFGGLGGGYGGYGAPGIYGDAGIYGGQGTYGRTGLYGGAGTSGGVGTYATQSLYGNGGGVPYRSEVPLAARFAEPPLGPSPYAPFSPDDRYAYAASEDVRPAARILRVHQAVRAPCLCGPGTEPALLPYGIGTAY